MTGNKGLLKHFVSKYTGNVKFGNDQVSPILGHGVIETSNLKIEKVSYVEGLGDNLFSIGQFCDKGMEVVFKKSSCSLRTEDGAEILGGNRKSNLYTIDLSEKGSGTPVCLLSKASSDLNWSWHRKLSHLNFKNINKLVNGNLVRGLPKLKFEKDHLCKDCEAGKMKRVPHKVSQISSTTAPLQLIHMDLCGPMKVQTRNAKRYILVMVDDYSPYT